MDLTWKWVLTVCALLFSLLVLQVENGDRGPNDRLLRWAYFENRYRFLVVHPDGTLRRHTKTVVIGFHRRPGRADVARPLADHGIS